MNQKSWRKKDLRYLKGRKKNANSYILLLSSKIATMEFYFAL